MWYLRVAIPSHVVSEATKILLRKPHHSARAYQVGDRFSGVEAELLRYGAILRVLRSA